jgi:regulator of replication initiation timing
MRQDELKRLGVAVGGDPKETVELYCLAQELGVEEKFLALLRRNEDFGSIRTYLFLEDMSRVVEENKKLRLGLWELREDLRNTQIALTELRSDFNELASEVLRMDMARLKKDIEAMKGGE